MIKIIYKEIPEEDEQELRRLIKTVIGELENPEFFMPFTEWEYEKMFDVSYAPLYGAYVEDELVAMAQLYIDQSQLQEYIEKLDLQGKKVCELGGALCMSNYRRNGIMTHLMDILMDLAKNQNFDYIVTMAHPDNIASNTMIKQLGLNYVKTATVNEVFVRNLYLLKI